VAVAPRPPCPLPLQAPPVRSVVVCGAR
jgi:hypothetical protein